MAGQRRGEPDGLRGGSRSRLDRLALALPLLLIAAGGWFSSDAPVCDGLELERVAP
jgi:hypothetical protein